MQEEKVLRKESVGKDRKSMHHGECNRFILQNKHPTITIGENNECSGCYIGYINHALIVDRQTTVSIAVI